MRVCVWKGAGDNYIEVVETGGLLIPNAVTLIKADSEGGVQTTGAQFNSEQKKLVIYLIGNQSSYAAHHPAKLKKWPLCICSGYPNTKNAVEGTAENAG